MRKRSTRTRTTLSSKSRPRRRQRQMKKPVRMTVMMLVAAVVIFIVGAVLAKAARPYLISWGEQRQIAEVKKQIAHAEAENRALKQDIRYLQTTQGMEVEARRLGWVKKNETSVMIQEAPDAELREHEGSGGHGDLWQTLEEQFKRIFSRAEPAS